MTSLIPTLSPPTNKNAATAIYVNPTCLFLHPSPPSFFSFIPCYFFLFPLQPDENKHILALQFSWKNGIKPKGSIFIGVSPEFEFALYTLCFLTSPNERVKVQFSYYDVEIVCHHYNQKHIGTTFPVLLRYLKPQ